MPWASAYRPRRPLRVESEARDRSSIKHIYCIGGGGGALHAARGLISSDISKKVYVQKRVNFLTYLRK